jgi:hypothetical protein
VIAAVRDLFQVDFFMPSALCSDCAPAIRAAAEEVWPGVVWVPCWPHIARKWNELHHGFRMQSSHDFLLHGVDKATFLLHIRVSTVVPVCSFAYYHSNVLV